MAKAFIVGVGPGDAGWLTDFARQAIARSDAVLGWELNLVPLSGLLMGKRLFIQRPGDYEKIAEEAAANIRAHDGTIAIVRIGDALVSSGLTGLLALFHDFEIEIIPGISSVQLAGAATGINLDEAAVVSFHEERSWEDEQAFMLDAFRRGRHLVVLTGPRQHPNETARFLIAQGIRGDTAAWVGESLTLPEDRRTTATLEDVAHREFHWLSVLVVLHPTGINPLWAGRIPAERRQALPR